ncbi:MAG: hypothetical protein LCH63_17735 [Candidatus Melainabacteria bacterium]|nr:hypothetical protein [Candidatus Melainabacteria bacterium]OPZ91206.1 MAG: hypothetical protein BWY75_00421 [bacterium ADurb.Bin425]
MPERTLNSVPAPLRQYDLPFCSEDESMRAEDRPVRESQQNSQQNKPQQNKHQSKNQQNQQQSNQQSNQKGIVSESILPLQERANSFWLKVRSAHGIVEGKLHLPDKVSTKLFVFQPGFPGRGAADFEALHLRRFLEEGHVVFTPRHNGSRLTGKFSDRYISCPERQELAKRDGQEAIGEDEISPLSIWLDEPLTNMEVLSPCFAETVFYGHSFGGLATMHSACKYFQNNAQGSIKRLVVMAGATGRIRSETDHIVKMWSEHLDTEYIRERVVIGDAANNLETLKAAYKAIHDSAANIPHSVDIIFLHPWGDTADSIDELIGVNEPLEMIMSLGRGTLIVDTTQKANAALEQLAHDMVDLSTEAMLKISNPSWQPPSQIMKLTAAGL